MEAALTVVEIKHYKFNHPELVMLSHFLMSIETKSNQIALEMQGRSHHRNARSYTCAYSPGQSSSLVGLADCRQRSYRNRVAHKAHR